MTFTIRAIQAVYKAQQKRTIAVPTSAIAATVLDGGRTAHSLFKIPISARRKTRN